MQATSVMMQLQRIVVVPLISGLFIHEGARIVCKAVKLPLCWTRLSSSVSSDLSCWKRSFGGLAMVSHHKEGNNQGKKSTSLVLDGQQVDYI